MLFLLLWGGSTILVLILAFALTIFRNEQRKKKTRQFILKYHGKEKGKNKL